MKLALCAGKSRASDYRVSVRGEVGGSRAQLGHRLLHPYGKALVCLLELTACWCTRRRQSIELHFVAGDCSRDCRSKTRRALSTADRLRPREHVLDAEVALRASSERALCVEQTAR